MVDVDHLGGATCAVDVDQVRAGNAEDDRRDNEQSDADDRFCSKLAPGEVPQTTWGDPDEGAEPATVLAWSHVGEDQVLQVQLVDGPRRVVDRTVVFHDEGRLAGGVAPFDPVPTREARSDPPRRGDAEAVMDREQLVDVSGDLVARRCDEARRGSHCTRSRSATRCDESTTLTPWSTSESP